MITIQAGSVAELRKIFNEMFPMGAPDAPAPRAEKKKVEPKPEAPKAEPKQEEAAQVQVEIPEEKKVTLTLTSEAVVEKAKKLKMTTEPEILAKVGAWREEKGYPPVKEMSQEQLQEVWSFLTALENK